MLDLAIILPTLNERDNIAPLVERLDAALAGIRWEAIFVDDNSEDGTAEAVRKLAHTHPHIRVIQRFGRRGLASAAIEGMCATTAPFVAVMDADHQHDPALLPAMLEAVRDGHADVAVASRFADGANADGLDGDGRQRASGIANALARRITGTALTDPMSGFFLLRSDLVRALTPRLSGVGFKILLDILATAPAALRVQEFPLQFAERRSGTSKLDRAVAFEFLVGIYDRDILESADDCSALRDELQLLAQQLANVPRPAAGWRGRDAERMAGLLRNLFHRRARQCGGRNLA